MKKVIISLCFVLFSLSSFSQEFFIGTSKNDIVRAMDSLGAKLALSDKTTKEKWPFDVYESKTDSFVFYYNDKNICIMMSRTYNISDLKSAVDMLNKKHVRYDDRSWMTQDLKINITIKIFDTAFTITYK